jgi:hypothetical protein
MIKLAGRQPSYFDGMEIGETVPIINRDRFKLDFTKTSEESGRVDLNVDERVKRSFEIDYDFNNFPSLKERFVKRLRYLLLRDFAITQIQNEDLSDTKLGLIDNLDLGYGFKVVKIDPSQAPEIARSLSSNQGQEVPDDPSQVLPQGYLPDFVYAIYGSKNQKQVPLGIFAIPFQMADEVYELHNLDDVRSFFIDLAEEQIGAPISGFKELLKDNVDQDGSGEFERIDTGHLSQKDILDFYNEKSKDLPDNSPEKKRLISHVNQLIQKMQDGETITKSDLLAAPIEFPVMPSSEPIKDYRKTIMLSRVKKNIYQIESLFEQRMKTEKDEGKISAIRQYYFDLKEQLSDQQIRLEEAKDVQPIIKDINQILENAANFIKK